MKLSTIRRILREDLARGGPLPDWIDALISPINDFLDQVGRALNGRLTFRDNYLCVSRAVELSSDVATDISSNAQSPYGVLCMNAGGKTLSGFYWTFQTNGNVSVKATFAEGGKSTCTILIFLG